MSLRLKIILALTAIAAMATVAIGVASYTATKHELEETVERSLQAAAREIADRPSIGDGDGDEDDLPGAGGRRPGHDRPRSFEQVLVQVIDGDGNVLLSPNSGDLPVSDDDIAVATSSDPRAQHWSEFEIDGEPYRMLTVQYGDTEAVQLARSLRESQQAIERIQSSTLVAVLLVTMVTLLLGWLIARQVTRRLERLTDVAGEVADTGRLDVEVPVDGKDETGQLGRAFRGMLDALQRSKQEQQQLVQDAGHELRTPLTSLRTNISVLRRRFDTLPAESREQLLNDLDSETRELTDLVNELVELATDRRDDELVQPVRLADIAERAAARARRRFNRDVVVDADDSLLDARPNALERAMQNLVDNACKFAPDGPVEVSVLKGLVAVRDHGPGLVADDIPHLFDRFYRSVEMRSKPGSGLGLSIVKSIIEGHGGQVFARNADGGGAEIGFALPLPTE
ncbi:MAG: HAMP domain-containing histidine kinase [Actinobacteria bacterium]|nr:HAMP domain-containing histidine kinase [Actinomycetota bacterium]